MTRISITLIFFLVTCSNTFLIAQIDYEWWNQKHHWDGVTPWSRYIVMSSAFMGPNALPVPELKDGSFNNKTVFELGGETHQSRGDVTKDIYTGLFIPVCANKVGLNLSYVPIEYFEMDTITRDMRFARFRDGKGTSLGDVYIGTYIQLVKDKKKLPDILLTINLKTASGTNSASARNTDTPGYYFDLSFGKKIMTNKNNFRYLNLYAMMGFYCYQTNRADYFQNDSELYGVGFDLMFNKFQIKNNLVGCHGYIGNGDSPAVYRLSFITELDKFVNYKILVQKGLNDFDYTTVRLAALFNFTKLRAKKVAESSN